MKAIRIKFFQETASFKLPMWNGSILPTYPLPPYSTVIGMIHTLCQWNTTHRIKLSIVCNNQQLGAAQQGLYRGYIGGTTFSKITEEMEARWPIIVEGAFDDYIGFTTRIYTTEFLVDRYYTLHVTTENEEDFNKIIEVFNYPPVYPSLGRWEDSIRIDEVKIVEIADELKSGELNCFVWLPGRYSSLQDFSTVWKIPTYYNLVRDKRKFEYLKCYLGERGDLATFRLDEDGENVLLI